MTNIDWIVVAVFFVLIIGVGVFSRRYMKSVADWLVAGRGVGRYLGIVADTGQATGLMTIVAWMQTTYGAGPAYWWNIILTVSFGMILAVTGWGVYRLRETKIMTLNELIEKRYSRKLRIFSGFICFLSGVINMGIFPIVSGRFLVYFCGLPEHVAVLGMSIPTVHIITALISIIAVLFCFVGGQVSIVITNFLQTAIMMIMYLVVGVVVYRAVSWSKVEAAYLAQPNMNELVNPTNLSGDFNLIFYITLAFSLFYNRIVWAPNTICGQSAIDPREAKIMVLWAYLRTTVGVGLLCFTGVACFAYMNLPIFEDKAAVIRESLANISNPQIYKQMVAPVFLAKLMPAGLTGLLVAGMLAAFISTQDAYLLAWGGVFIQDVVMPLRKRPLGTKQHIWLLRWAVIGIAILIFLFGIFYRETEYLVMFMFLTFAIFTSGAGVTILGGLYWRRGNSAGAWAAMITGTTLPIAAIFLQQIWTKVEFLRSYAEKFPLSGVEIALLSSLTSIVVYVLVSWLTTAKFRLFDLDELLHRKGGVNVEVALKMKGTGNWFFQHFYQIMWVVAIGLTGAVVVTMAYNVIYEDRISPLRWLSFWKYWIFIMFFASVPLTFWLIGGGIRDMARLFKRLARERVDERDDGFVAEAKTTGK